jgi:hypothetical protein
VTPHLIVAQSHNDMSFVLLIASRKSHMFLSVSAPLQWRHKRWAG